MWKATQNYLANYAQPIQKQSHKPSLLDGVRPAICLICLSFFCNYPIITTLNK